MFMCFCKMIFSNKFGFILETLFSYILILLNKVGVYYLPEVVQKPS
jgi:hypothetical protein